MSESVQERVIEVFQAVFELPAETDVRTLEQSTAEAWDSIGHVNLITALESEFEIDIPAGDSLEVTSFEEALWLVEDLLEEKA